MTTLRRTRLITGASGFIGHRVVVRSVNDGVPVRAAIRRAVDLPEDVVPVRVGDLEADTDWTDALNDVDTVVHAAARVHIMEGRAAQSLAEFRRVNVAGTLTLARRAAAAGVRRFAFVSSIKVLGEGTVAGRPYTADDAAAPRDAYGVSKHEAEEGLRKISRESGLEVVIIRPVLVYGPGVKANFQSMMQWLYRGVPLPFGSVDNRRSLVALDTLVDLIVTCLDHPAAANQTFLVSDGEDLSTPSLLRRTAAALGCRARLIPVPVAVLHQASQALGKEEFMRRLGDSLQVDINKTRTLLGWTPPLTVHAALRQTAEHFLANRQRPSRRPE